MIFIAAVLVIAAAALFVVGYLGWSDRLPRNRWVGMRTKTTMSSDAVWRVAHHKAGPWFVISGVMMLPGAIVSGFADSTPVMGIAGGVVVVLALFIMAGGVMTAADAARRALREELGQAPQERP